MATDIIYLNSNPPETQTVRNSLTVVDKLPITGMVIHASYTDPQYGLTNFSNHVWHNYSIPISSLATPIKNADVINGKAKRVIHNYFPVNLLPGDVDWFDTDMSHVIDNFVTAAKFCYDSGMEGVFIDTENYSPSTIFQYSTRPGKDSHTFDEYKTQATIIGGETIAAMLAVNPHLKIWFTFMYEQLFFNPNPNDGTNRYSLLCAFLDGFVNGNTNKVPLIDGFEDSYSYTQVNQYITNYAQCHTGNASLSAYPDAYKAQVQCSFGKMLDFGGTWDVNNFANNYYPPDAWEAAIRRALKTSDNQIWLYMETPQLFPLANMPQAYMDAFVRAIAMS